MTLFSRVLDRRRVVEVVGRPSRAVRVVSGGRVYFRDRSVNRATRVILEVLRLRCVQSWHCIEFFESRDRLTVPLTVNVAKLLNTRSCGGRSMLVQCDVDYLQLSRTTKLMTAVFRVLSKVDRGIRKTELRRVQRLSLSNRR